MCLLRGSVTLHIPFPRCRGPPGVSSAPMLIKAGTFRTIEDDEWQWRVVSYYVAANAPSKAISVAPSQTFRAECHSGCYVIKVEVGLEDDAAEVDDPQALVQGARQCEVRKVMAVSAGKGDPPLLQDRSVKDLIALAEKDATA